MAELDEAKIRQIVQEAVKETVREAVRETIQETLRALGVDADKPFELQQDFAFLRGLREFTAAGRRHLYFVMIGVLVTGLAAAVWSSVISTVVRGTTK
jgi:hypothetical protein